MPSSRDRYGQKDVFSLADQLYAAVELRGAPASNPGTKRYGDFSDLARGLVFAAPALMFAGAALALGSWLTWWSTPLALMWGWAFSQFLAYVSFSRRAWGKPAGSAVAWGILAALVSCCCLGIAGDALLGGNIHGVVFAAGACAFMTAAAELLARQQERLVALMLLPGAIGSVIFVVKEPVRVPPDVVLALATASVAGTVLLALRHLPAHWWRSPHCRWPRRPRRRAIFARPVLRPVRGAFHGARARDEGGAGLAGGRRLPDRPVPRGHGVAVALAQGQRPPRPSRLAHAGRVHPSGPLGTGPLGALLHGRASPP